MAVAVQRFCFFNHCVEFSAQPGWHDHSLSRLWRFHLHYFDFLNDLLIWSATGQSAAAYEAFRTLASSWIDCNQTFDGDGWHPYTLSVRLVNWLHAATAFDLQLMADEPFRQRLLSSIYGQAQVLFSDLELDVRGNHLVKNLRALLFVSLIFKGPEPQRWFQQALRLLEQELAEQILSDGGHFERSPGYHLEVLKDCLEIAIWLRRNKNTSPKWLDGVLRRMLDYLIAIMSPDGRVPLLKDTAWDSAPGPNDLLAAGALYLDESFYKRSDDFGFCPFLSFGLSGWERFKEWPTNDLPRISLALREIGHYVMRDDRNSDYLIFDAGKPCPEYLPAHAHADMLSYELTVSGQRVVVDSGVYDYCAGPWRDFFRSTRAHNTVEVGGQNQSEVWGSFRVARRARPGSVVWQQTGDYVLLQGAHDGYHRLPVPVIHRRTVVWRRDYFWLFVDELWGNDLTTMANYVHLHPALALEAVDGSSWRFRGCHFPLWITAFGHRSWSIVRGQISPLRQGWYSERFGELRPNTVLTLHLRDDLPMCCGYVVSRQNLLKIQSVQATAGRKIILTDGKRGYTLHLARDVAPHFSAEIP